MNPRRSKWLDYISDPIKPASSPDYPDNCSRVAFTFTFISISSLSSPSSPITPRDWAKSSAIVAVSSSVHSQASSSPPSLSEMSRPLNPLEVQHQAFHAAAEATLKALRLQLTKATKAARDAEQRAQDAHKHLVAQTITWNRANMEWVEGLLRDYNNYVESQVGHWRRLAHSAIIELHRTRRQLAQAHEELSRTLLRTPEVTRTVDHVAPVANGTGTATTTATTDDTRRTTINQSVTTVASQAPSTGLEPWALPFGCESTSQLVPCPLGRSAIAHCAGWTDVPGPDGSGTDSSGTVGSARGLPNIGRPHSR